MTKKLFFLLTIPFMGVVVYIVSHPVLLWLRTFMSGFPAFPVWFVFSILLMSISISYMIPYGNVSSILHLIGEAFFPSNVLFVTLVIGAELICVILPDYSVRRVGNIVLFIFLVISLLGIINAFTIREKRYTIKLSKPHRPIRIALISDLHLGFFSDKNIGFRIAHAVIKVKPDIVIIAGDLFDDRYEMLRNSEHIIKDLNSISKIAPVYACEGNHDLFSDSSEAKGFLNACGIELVRDGIITWNGYDLILRRDYKSERKSPETILQLSDKTNPVIVVDHNPKDAAKLLSLGADIVLSGHTHGGQTFPGNLYYKLLPMQTYGKKAGENGCSIVTSGIGFYGLPIRFGVNSEVAVIDIE